MEIIVEGVGTKKITPDEVILNLTFNYKNDNYNQVLKEGTEIVANFISDVLEPNKFTKEDLKTSSFVIRENTKYNEITKRYELDGYLFEQRSKLIFDYDKEKKALIMEAISKFYESPKCIINFDLKNKKECRKNVLSLAYKDALEQANAIAEAAETRLVGCMKVDFKPFTTTYVSNSNLDNDGMLYRKAAYKEAASNIINTFNPEDIIITEKLYCLWIAE